MQQTNVTSFMISMIVLAKDCDYNEYQYVVNAR